MEDEPMTPEETALRDTLSIFAYEIDKNERQIIEWEHTVTMNSAEAAALQGADRRCGDENLPFEGKVARS
jgi:hypothetical protein